MPHGKMPAGLRRVLVVDDDRDMGQSIAMLLRARGHVAVFVDEPVKALEAAKAMRPEIALVDLWMPVVDGYMLARILRGTAELKDLFLVALAGLGRPEAPERSREAGFDLQITKPLDVPALESVFGQFERRRRSA
jgi:CheY-like chemotaxis protein